VRLQHEATFKRLNNAQEAIHAWLETTRAKVG
jgi:hypothetical protein